MSFAPIRIQVPNPYFESDVSAWLIPGQPLTLIDTGVRTPDAWEALENGIKGAGYDLTDVDQIVLTHKHPDHAGLAARLKELSGAGVMVHWEEAGALRAYDSVREEFVQRLRADLHRWEVPEKAIENLLLSVEMAGTMGETCEVEDLEHGQEITTAAGPLIVYHTPGHTQGSICLRLGHYWFTGDHLLSGYTPNVGTGEFDAKRMLDKFLRSHELLAEWMEEDSVVLPGHGAPLEQPHGRIAEIVRHHRERDAAILSLLGPEPMSVFETANRLFGGLSGIHILLGTSEVAAHLESLEAAGRVERQGNKYLPVLSV